MQNYNSKFKICLFSFLLLVLSGCSVVEYLTPEKPSRHNEQITECCRQIKLKTSTSADVLAIIHGREYELLSQSKNVIVSSGQKKEGYKNWFVMVAFDENELTARRKYLFIADEKPKVLFVSPREGLIFDCEMVIGNDVLNKPYSNENARRIAILRQVQENAGKDADEVSKDNKTIAICGMLINQALETVLVKLDESPALAARLNEPNGIKFEHTSFDKGKIQMVVTDDTASVKMKLGSFARHFEDTNSPKNQSSIK
jgi:hypothetical protein